SLAIKIFASDSRIVAGAPSKTSVMRNSSPDSSQRTRLFALANLQNLTWTCGRAVRGRNSRKTRENISSGVSKKIADCSTLSEYILSLNARRAALGKRSNVGQFCHCRIAGESGEKRPVRPTQPERVLRRFTRQQAVEESGRESVTAAD